MTQITVIIDVFRAFTTAAYVLARDPASYTVAIQQEVIAKLAAQCIDPLVIGKAEIGKDGRLFHIPNSPTRAREHSIARCAVLHRSEAGVHGILQTEQALTADVVLAAGFVNAGATVAYIRQYQNPVVTLVPMGHRGTEPALEDNLCADYISALLKNETFDFQPFIEELKQGSGSYFFSEDQFQYPQADFKRCLKLDRYDFAIQAEIMGDYAVLTRCQALS